MKTNKEVAAEALNRAAKLNKNKKKHWMGTAGMAAACLAIVVGLSYAISQMSSATNSNVKPGSEYSAAVFAGGNAGGYVLVGVIAFALGVLVTVIAIRSQRKK